MIKKAILILIIVITSVVITSGKKIYHYSESPSFCNSCHLMNYLNNRGKSGLNLKAEQEFKDPYNLFYQIVLEKIEER